MIHVTIDTPTALSILTASNSAIVTLQAEWFIRVTYIENISETIESMRDYCNEKLFIKGILII